MPKYYGFVPYKPPPQQARPIPVVHPKPAPVYKKVLYGEAAVWWPATNEWLKYRISLNVDANGKQAVTNIKLEGADKQKYENGGPVIVSLKGQRTATYQFRTTGVWVKPNSKNGEYYDADDLVSLRVTTIQVQ